MKNELNEAPITSAEFFLLMRLLQTLEDSDTLPQDQDWQTIYAKLSAQCLAARKNRPAVAAH
jgi:hypothetical protein